MGSASIGRHRFAIFTATATWVLIFVGGLVTSTGSGLAVPDWPLSFGQFFPRMVGGVFYEHGHRMVAAAVIAQGLLGGLTVVLLLPPAVSVAHACLAQAFLCLTVTIAVITRPGWSPAT